MSLTPDERAYLTLIGQAISYLLPVPSLSRTRRAKELAESLNPGLPEVEPIPEGDDSAQKVLALALARLDGLEKAGPATSLLARALVAILREHFHLVPRE